VFKKLFIIGDRIARNRILQHILFWALSFLVLINILKVSADIQPIDFVYTAFFHLPVLVAVYLNLFVLFPLFLEKRRFMVYGLLVAAVLTLGWLLYDLLFGRWIDYIFPGYYFIAYYNFRDIVLYLSIYIASTSLIKLARGWFRLQEIQKEKTLIELKALKSQVNPHFLFNSLNSIFSLARKSSPVLPEVILRLSRLMRYVIYETDVEQISLKREIEVLKDYIELQKLRSHDSENIQMEIIGEIEDHTIAPLLFLPFTENSFKHGIKGGIQDPFIHIRFEITGGVLNFEIENKKAESGEIPNRESKGIGIRNVQRRLNLIYPGAHLLKISETAERFKVLVQVQLI